MNNEQVMRLMADIGLHEGGMDNWVLDNAWVKFADLVAAQEREACAGLAERRLLIDKNKNRVVGFHYAVKEIAADIRARGTT